MLGKSTAQNIQPIEKPIVPTTCTHNLSIGLRHI